MIHNFLLLLLWLIFKADGCGTCFFQPKTLILALLRDCLITFIAIYSFVSVLKTDPFSTSKQGLKFTFKVIYIYSCFECEFTELVCFLALCSVQLSPLTDRVVGGGEGGA